MFIIFVHLLLPAQRLSGSYKLIKERFRFRDYFIKWKLLTWTEIRAIFRSSETFWIYEKQLTIVRIFPVHANTPHSPSQMILHFILDLTPRKTRFGFSIVQTGWFVLFSYDWYVISLNESLSSTVVNFARRAIKLTKTQPLENWENAGLVIIVAGKNWRRKKNISLIYLFYIRLHRW